MRPPSILPSVFAALLALAGTAHAEPEAMAEPSGAALPPVSARPALEPPTPRPAPSELLGRLPPAAALPAEAVVSDSLREGPAGEIFERVAVRSGEGGATEWVEVQYTVDAELERRVRKVLQEGRVPLGHVIVMRPDDGAVLAYVSTDPGTFPATGTYPTASLMKVVTAAAVLRHAPAAAERDCRYAGSPYEVRKVHLRPPRQGGRIDNFWRALAISNNQCFARLAVHDVGREHLVEEMARVGLLEPPAPGHDPGRLQRIETDVELGHLGSGLAGSFISPLAAARLAGVLATGSLVRPRWIARVTDEDGRELGLPALERPVPVWPPELTRELRELLVGVTARGTAKSAFRDMRGRPLLGPVRVSGKTGSLSGTNPKGRYEWFIGAAPAEQPSIVLATVVVNGPIWWRNASQVAALVLRDVFCRTGRCDPDAPLRQVARRAPADGAGE